MRWLQTRVCGTLCSSFSLSMNARTGDFLLQPLSSTRELLTTPGRLGWLSLPRCISFQPEQIYKEKAVLE